jgi:Fic family protein
MEIAFIEQLTKRYNQLAKGVVDYSKYAYYAITHHSTSIEGSTLTEVQVINLLEYGKTAISKPFEHHLMVHDHFKALQYVVELAKIKDDITPELIRSIGAIVMSSTGGEVHSMSGTYNIANGDFRLSTVRAGTRTFIDFRKVPAEIEKLCAEINEGLKSAKTFEQKSQLAFYAHFRLVSIHPFGDGNGRTSRLFMNYIQARFKLPLSIVFKQDRIKYINALELARIKEDLTPFYNFMFGQYAKFLVKEIKELVKGQ